MLVKINGIIFYCCGCESYVIFKGNVCKDDNRDVASVVLPTNDPDLKLHREHTIRMLASCGDPELLQLSREMIND
jgi:hypothetical protein